MSVSVFSEAWGKSQAKGGTLLVLLAIADHASLEGVAWPSEEALARKARLSERQVRTAINALVDMGEVEVWAWRSRAGLNRNGYRVLVGEFAELRGVEPEALRDKSTNGVRSKTALRPALRRRVFERDDNRCLACQSTDDLQIDHITPGGGNGFGNLQTLCSRCHRGKGQREISLVGNRKYLPLRTGSPLPVGTGSPLPVPRARDEGVKPEPSVEPSATPTVPAARAAVAQTWLAAPKMVQHRDSYWDRHSIRYVIDKSIKLYGIEDVCQAIRNYAEVFDSDQHFFKFRWTLEDFLGRGLDRFVPEADPQTTFLIKEQINGNGKKKKGSMTSQEIYDYFRPKT